MTTSLGGETVALRYPFCVSESSPAPSSSLPAVKQPVPLKRIWAARGLAAAADAVQIFLFPLFGEGFASPFDVVLDGAMAVILTKLVGFHWSYLPSVALELVPGMDLAPTWTAAALLATGGRGGSRKWLWLGVALAGVIAVMLVLWLWSGPPFFKR
jgi:hypothetical protein